MKVVYYFIVYECNLDNGYKISQSHGESRYMFAQTITYFCFKIVIFLYIFF